MKKYASEFGFPSDRIIGFDDWEQKKQIKYKELTKGIDMRNLFRKAGYQVYLVDELEKVVDVLNVKVNVKNSENVKIHDLGKRMKPLYAMGFSCVKHVKAYGIEMWIVLLTIQDSGE